MDHIDFMSGSETGATSDVDFATFLCLYLNHRRLAPTTQEDIDAAFRELGDAANGVVDRAALFDLASKQGDVLPKKELAELLATLTGAGADALPDFLNPVTFSQEVLGFE